MSKELKMGQEVEVRMFGKITGMSVEMNYRTDLPFTQYKVEDGERGMCFVREEQIIRDFPKPEGK